MRSGILLCAIGLVLALAGCGGSGGGSGSGSLGDRSADGVRATIRAYLEDIKNGRGGDACDLLTGAARTQVGGGDASACGARIVLARALLGQKALADLEAKVAGLNITISGDHATAPALTTSGGTTTLMYSGGHWLIASQ